jgi:hypothetical protein
MAGSSPEPRKRRRIAVWIGLALGVVALILLFYRGVKRHRAESAARNAIAEIGTPHGGSARGTPRPASYPAATQPTARATGAPIIDSITVEKSEVCEGEENLITIKAHSPDGSTAGLRYLVNGMPGQSYPLRSWVNDDPNAPPQSVLVLADGGSTPAEIPPFRIKKCEPTARLVLGTFPVANSTAAFRLEARVKFLTDPGLQRPAKIAMADFKPTHYEWDFGDGQKTTTQEWYTTHSYEFRDQRAYFSYYLLTVRAFDGAGGMLVARRSLEIMNPAYEELAQKRIVKIMSAPNPRFPELQDGVVKQAVRLWHFHPQAINVDRIIAYVHDRGGKELRREAVPPAAFLGTGAIPPGAGMSILVTLNAAENPDVGFITYDVQGTTADNMFAMGTFSIMRPVEPPTADNNMPVADPKMVARILRAREILGKKFVTDEEIWELGRQGAFDGLEPAPGGPPPDPSTVKMLPKRPSSPEPDPDGHRPDPGRPTPAPGRP